MITNTNKRVVCVKDIPSNIIEEAIFILKQDFDEEENGNVIKKQLISNEAHDFIREYSIDFEKEIIRNNNNIMKNKKIKMFIGTGLFVISCVIILLIYNFL